MFWRALLLGAVVLSVPGLAQAQDHDDEARTHFQSGRLHFERGAYEEAQAEFMAAYELSQRPDLLFNLFLCAERLGELDAAIDYLERYLAEATLDAETRTQLEPRLANLRERRDARVTEDPGGGDPAPAASGGDLVPALATYGVAAAGLISFAIFGGLALAEDDRLAGTCGVTCSGSQLSDLGTFALVADISWITAAVAAAVGTVLLVTIGLPSSPSSSAEGPAATLAPWASETGGGVAILGSF